MADVVSASDILKNAGNVKPATWTQQAGMKLAVGVGSLGTFVTLVILVSWCWTRPSTPAITSSLTPEQAQALVTNYKALSLEARDSATQLFDALVIRALLPVFTSIVGFVLGKEVGRGSA